MTIEEKFANILADGFTWRESVLLTDLNVEVLNENEARETWNAYAKSDPILRRRYSL